jgi:hypothetical protein
MRSRDAPYFIIFCLLILLNFSEKLCQSVQIEFSELEKVVLAVHFIVIISISVIINY